VRILFDHQIFSIQQHGGISRYFSEISSRINAYDEFYTEILAPYHQNYYLSSTKNVVVKGRYVRSFPMASSFLSVVNTYLSNITPKDFNVIHETYYNFPINPPKNSRIVTTVHDMIHEIFSNQFGANNKTSLKKKNSILKSDHIICVSENTKRDLINIYDVPNDKISVIYLGSSLSSTSKSAAQEYIGKPYFLYVGRRDGYKNFISLAKSIALSKKLRNQFSLVCFGGGEITKQELFQLNEIGFPLDDLVYRNGDDSALSWHYKNASALVVPSHYEGFGIPLLEAMSLRCPIACSNISSLPEIAGNAAAYFNPWEVDSIIDCLENIVFSPSQLEILSDAGESRIKNFSWDKCAKETSEAYKALK